MLKQIIFIFLLFFPVTVLPCETQPEEQKVDAVILIKRTKNIVLAKVVKAQTEVDKYEVKYTFKNIKVLKGNMDESFDLKGVPLIGGQTHFNHHYDSLFWDNGGNGRSLNYPDCKIHPSFAVGAIYLIFFDRPYHAKSFELIIRTEGNSDIKDKWLQYVEDQLKKT